MGIAGQRGQGFRDPGHPVGPVVTAPREHADPVALTPADEPEAVVFDFVDPLRADRHRASERRQAGFDEAGDIASG